VDPFAIKASGILNAMRTHVHTSRRHPIRVIIILLLLGLLCLRGCLLARYDGGEGDAARSAGYEEGPRLDPSGFTLQDGRYRYEAGGVVWDRTGIDVSDHQDAIDWATVASDGISFAMLRVGWRGNTEGGLYVDERFYENLSEAHAAGIACGAYFYSQATSLEEVQEEAAFVCDLLQGCTLEYPVAFDFEAEPGTRVTYVDRGTIEEMAGTFCEAIAAAGFTPMLYGNTYDLARYGQHAYDGPAIWCAEYDGDPSFDGVTSIWQYSNAGVVAGIESEVDLNLDLYGAIGQ